MIPKELKGLKAPVRRKLEDGTAFAAAVQAMGGQMTPGSMQKLADMGFPLPGGVEATQALAVIQAQYDKAINDGDTSAAVFIRDSGWGKPKDVVETTGEKNVTLSMDLLKVLQDAAARGLTVEGEQKAIEAASEVVVELGEDGSIKQLAGGGEQKNEAEKNN